MPKIRLNLDLEPDLQLHEILTDLVASSETLANFYYKFYKSIVVDDCMPDDSSGMAVFLHDAMKDLCTLTEQAQIYIKQINEGIEQ